MMTKCVALFCVLLIAELTFGQESCGNEENIFQRRAGCNVLEDIIININAKAITQTDKCNDKDTVCATTHSGITTIHFKGKMPNVKMLKISGGGKFAKLPVLSETIKKAKPEIAQWPLNPTDTPFTLPVMGVDTADGCTLKVEGVECPASGLCCTIKVATDTGVETLTISGTNPPDFITLSRKSTPSDTVVIPVIVKVENEESPTPKLLTVPRYKKIPPVQVHFPVETIKDGNTAFHELYGEESCAKDQACYLIEDPVSTVKFKGKMPTEPVTITVSDGKVKNTYMFTSKDVTI